MQASDPLRLTETETRDLHALVGMLLPASAEYGMPGADDAAIFASLLASLGRDTEDVQAGLATLTRLAGGGFAGLAPARRAEVMAAFNEAPEASALHRVLLLCYYRDDRVMTALGQEPRPPFPKGFTLEQGDWSLLDPVRARAPFWRQPG